MAISDVIFRYVSTKISHMKNFEIFVDNLENKAAQVTRKTKACRRQLDSFNLIMGRAAGYERFRRSAKHVREVKEYIRGEKNPMTTRYCPDTLKTHPKLQWYWRGMELYEAVFGEMENAEPLYASSCGEIVVAYLKSEDGGPGRYIVTDGDRSFDISLFYPPYLGYSLRDLLYFLPEDMSQRLEPLYYDFVKACDEELALSREEKESGKRSAAS